MSKIIQEELQKVEYANLSNFNAQTNTYIIPKRSDLKLEMDNCYLIHLKPAAFTNEVVKTNWNNGSVPSQEYMKVDVSKVAGKMAKVVGVGYDNTTQQDLGYFWSGWLSIQDIEIIKKL